jgi:hypothetical protein
MTLRFTRLKGLVVLAALAVAVPLATVAAAPAASAASSKFCTSGSYSVLGKKGVKDRFRGTVPAPAGRFTVQGRYNQFTVDPATFAIYDYAFTGAANTGSMTGGKLTPVYASKVPDHRGLTLSGGISLELRDEDMVISRTGPGGLTMKIQAKDCAQGGIFQMEAERGDGTATRITHTLAPTAFYYDNPNFRARLGQFLGSACTSVETGPPSQFCVRVSPRVNIGSDISPELILRDSAQVATRVPACADHCGGSSVWDVASGGRMGMVTGEDATEVANPPTTCTEDCQAENQVRGRLAVLGFPNPVPAASRLTPRVAS